MFKYTNKLAEETSPYLLQHAHNPVNWYPWGDEALLKSKEQDKPILVSIGYSACHWCHVMEHESFEDEETANLMNANFINIKIDREERPDLDHIYMDAVQAIAGNGGWPLNVFLTPDRKPFYGGTYFPPQRAFNRASWKEVLEGVYQLFKEKRQEIEAQAEELTKHIGRSDINPSTKNISLNITVDEIFTKQQVDEIFANIMKQADKKWGGFGNAPKFPQTFTINYLLRYYHYTKNEKALKQACLSLDKMIQGGIYDQIGGGFARYSTDTEWLAPHFEKMLYDNALLVRTLSDAYQITKNLSYKKTIEQTTDFIVRELSDGTGSFYSALDADSEGEEGKFYVWSYDEINTILGNDAKLFCEYYDVTPNGNWSEGSQRTPSETPMEEHKNILRVLTPLHDFAEQQNLNETDIGQQLKSSEEKLLNERSKRVRPLSDDKILLGWNALMITALCKAAAALSNNYYKELAIKNFDFLFSNFRVNENDPMAIGFEFYHTYKNGKAKYPAFLDDYAYLIEACIALQEVTSDNKYLQYAQSLTEYVYNNFYSSENDFFYYSGLNQNDVIVRKKEIYDGAIPSGNSVMSGNLFYLSVIFDNTIWKENAAGFLKTLAGLIIKYPTSFGNWACLLIDIFAGINELAICGQKFEILRDELLTHFIPNKVVQCSYNAKMNEYPLLAQKCISPKPLIYLCRNYTCQAPTDDIASIITRTSNYRKFN